MQISTHGKCAAEERSVLKFSRLLETYSLILMEQIFNDSFENNDRHECYGCNSEMRSISEN